MTATKGDANTQSVAARQSSRIPSTIVVHLIGPYLLVQAHWIVYPSDQALRDLLSHGLASLSPQTIPLADVPQHIRYGHDPTRAIARNPDGTASRSLSRRSPSRIPLPLRPHAHGDDL